jgi:hypothetical protein
VSRAGGWPGEGREAWLSLCGIGHRDQPPAAHDELVDGVERLRPTGLWACATSSTLHVRLDHLRIAPTSRTGEELAQLVHRDEGLPTPGWRIIIARGSPFRAGGEHAHHRPARVRTVPHQPRQVVFQEALAVRLEEGDHPLIVEQVDAGQAEIDRLSAWSTGTPAGRARRRGPRLAEGLGVEEFEAARGRRLTAAYSSSMARTRSA